MKDWFSHFIKQSISHSSILVIIITFLESLAIVGLILPGIIFMTTLGTLIGNGKISFFSTWLCGFIGCSLGDYLSYYIGWKFKNSIYNITFFRKNMIFLNKITNIILNYSMITILIGKFVGPTRPLIPMIAGIVKIPIQKFAIPSFIGCIIWPVLYFLPGIITGILINHPEYYYKIFLIKWIIPIIILTFGIIAWYAYKYKKSIIL